MYLNVNGNSDCQQTLEPIITERLKEQLQITDLQCNKFLSLPKEKGVKIKPDFYSKKHKIIGEIHAHLGKLKPAQKDKIAADILKMHLYDPDNEYQKYYVVCSEDEYAFLTGKSYVAAALRRYKVKPVFVKLNEDESQWLSDTMKKQNMFYEPTMEGLSVLYENTFGAPPPRMLLLGMDEDQMKKEIQEAIDSGTEIHVDLEPGAVI